MTGPRCRRLFPFVTIASIIRRPPSFLRSREQKKKDTALDKFCRSFGTRCITVLADPALANTRFISYFKMREKPTRQTAVEFHSIQEACNHSKWETANSTPNFFIRSYWLVQIFCTHWYVLNWGQINLDINLAQPNNNIIIGKLHPAFQHTILRLGWVHSIGYWTGKRNSGSSGAVVNDDSVVELVSMDGHDAPLRVVLQVEGRRVAEAAWIAVRSDEDDARAAVVCQVLLKGLLVRKVAEEQGETSVANRQRLGTDALHLRPKLRRTVLAPPPVRVQLEAQHRQT